MDKIIIKGARENNLKNIDIEIPKNKFVIITGVSGCGKSSLAFNTIYEEGKRRYIESLSSYARMFLGGNEKPDVDSIEGLTPAISIEQKTTNNNPRSTVGTITEIYDYLRLLFAKIGVPYCPNGHGKIEALTIEQIKEKIINELNENDKFEILAPIFYHQKGTFIEELEKIKKQGFFRVRIDKNVYLLENEEILLDKNKFHDLDVVVDRIIFHNDDETKTRLNEALERTIKTSEGKVILVKEDKEVFFSQTHACKICGFTIPELEPRLFSFNSPTGACDVCKGLGYTFEPDENKMIPNWEKTINEGAIDFFKNTVNTTNLEWQTFDSLTKFYKINKDTPIKELEKKQIEILLEGSKEPINYSIKSSSGNIFKKYDYIEGIMTLVKRRHLETTSTMAREYYAKYLSEKKCKCCNGKKLNEAAISVKINKKDIIEVTELSISECLDFFLNLNLQDTQKIIADPILKELIDRLSFLNEVGLGYISLSRSASSLSGGEAQRIRLATQIGSKLSGVLYVLDEPSIGLHQKDNTKLIKALKNMRDLGNSLLVVEHDLETIEESDYIIDMGPFAGSLGGEITACGTLEQIKTNPNSLTGKYLSNELNISIPSKRRKGNGKKIIMKGITHNNLKNVDLTIPLGVLTCVTGISGSGKSSLITEVLALNLQKTLTNPFINAPKVRDINGFNNIDKLILVNQEPIGRTPKSNPATYVGVFDDIRDLFASLPDSKVRGYTKSRFSFNVPGGRCEKCNGDGEIKIDMHFLPSVYVKCDECDGKKFNKETLSITYKGKNIYDILEMTVDEALIFFKNIPNIFHKLKLMQEVGIGYLKLGLNSTKLSGGEAQRIKLAKFLQKNSNSRTLLILDEPTTGLHIDDIKKLIMVLNKIVDTGATIVVIEHNLDLIKCADNIIDIGPDGGIYGGKIIATGTVEQIIQNNLNVSYTAQYLKKIIEKEELKQSVPK
ncbi:MAG: excinuclease ABC subunit UvrA [Mycoplasmataceae bacterium]|nr:excinuclease ABC subunit UvrA [Mycoplasmataceae bacterium]